MNTMKHIVMDIRCALELEILSAPLGMVPARWVGIEAVSGRGQIATV